MGLDLSAIIVLAISGGLTAVRAQLDVVGVLVLATVTGLGGGVLRDVFIGASPPAAFLDGRYLLAAVVAGSATFLLHPALERAEGYINVFDAFGLGLFTAAGAVKAVDHGLAVLPAILVGVVAGVGGGIMRDTLIDRVPLILRKDELYAIPASAGATIAVVGLTVVDAVGPSVVAAASVTIVWRLLAIWRGWTAPEPVRVRTAT
ncbi:trimeric intracellular cation channel family protein [Nocardioides jejuensis]|uniref:Trimeric intracellular cation channel family protein n=1 Tax=Nocardioides jejuensis TaxID=2502782 RepID=A0A4R1CBR7_9ACTN|nr:TRIC cation channel family protein [Nocardioides jejuensis]TCJ28360.1 trimeric intracellular cation channel family protein [Nocardioides jejuensis]